MTAKQFRVEEASVSCGVDCKIIIHFIEEEWIQPLDKEKNVLDEEDIARITLISDLSERYGVNEESMPIILNLVDQLNRMHLELERFKMDKHDNS